MDTLDLRINRTVEVLKAKRGAEWLLEQLQALNALSLQQEPSKQAKKLSSVVPISTTEDEDERAAWSMLATHGLAAAYAEEGDFEYTLINIK